MIACMLIGDRAGPLGPVKVVENFESENEAIDWLAENEHGWITNPLVYIIDEYLGVMLPIEIGMLKGGKTR